MIPDTSERKIFTLEEALRLLPEVRERTRLALDRIGGLENPTEEDEDPDDRRQRLEKAAAGVLADWAEEMESLGLEAKGPWLVDFDSGGGYYCWRWPEGSLEFFHSYEEGFAGRVRLQ